MLDKLKYTQYKVISKKRQRHSLSLENWKMKTGETNLCVGEVWVPRVTQRLLSSDVPHYKPNVLPDDLFHVAAYSWRRLDDFIHQTTSKIKRHITKLVIRLSVNRLPVKLPITGCTFKLPIIDLPTIHFSLRNEISDWSFVSVVFTQSHRQTKT